MEWIVVVCGFFIDWIGLMFCVVVVFVVNSRIVLEVDVLLLIVMVLNDFLVVLESSVCRIFGLMVVLVKINDNIVVMFGVIILVFLVMLLIVIVLLLRFIFVVVIFG